MKSGTSTINSILHEKYNERKIHDMHTCANIQHSQVAELWIKVDVICTAAFRPAAVVPAPP